MSYAISQEMAPFAEGAIPDITPVSYGDAVANANRAAYTLFATPEHERLHQVLEAQALDLPPRPMHASLGDTMAGVQDSLATRANLVATPPMDGARLVQLGGVLIQFADYTPRLQDQVRVPYDNIAGLHGAVRTRAAEDGPLGMAEQLDVALEFNNNNVVNSLWNLFTTSRLYARWLDASIVDGLPSLDAAEKVRLMHQWRESITAFKKPQVGRSQDPSGDAYYAWTHALAKVVYSTAPARPSALSRATVGVFHRGTNIMHRVVHTFVKQGVDSNHSKAASYGNAVGQTIVDALPKR